MQAIICAALAGPALADVVTCDLSGVPVRFEIDRTQFAPAFNPDEPPRRRVTTVAIGSRSFEAEPMVLGDTLGFWATEQNGAEIMLVKHADGSAVYIDPTANQRLTGRCEVMQ